MKIMDGRLPPLTVIEASAGTGKTFSLVTRLLRLIFSGTEPERIVALTFSRMAAGEIFNSFIERLSRAAMDQKTAAEESARMGRELKRADFAAKLRLVISRQHLSLIGTLDSFMMRVVRMIPLELGLEGEISVMSDYRSPLERMKLVGEMMMRGSDDAKSIFRQAFRLAFGGAGAKSFLERFSKFIDGWHFRYRDFSEAGVGCEGWGGEEAIWGGDVPCGLDVSLADIRALADSFGGYAGKKGADKFTDAVRNFSGSVPPLPKCMAGDPAARDALAKMNAWKISLSLKETRGIYLLMSAYEAAYASKVRARGLVTFDDLPRLLNSLPRGVKLPLEYRMDARFDHWALDEFQDTSRGQWKALENLLSEAGGPDSSKSVFIVGDRKQSIYEWRGGDVEILGRQVVEASKDGNLLQSLDESYRYAPVISEAVNRVFGEDTVRGAIDMDDARESARWKCREHVSHDGSASGYVQVIQAVKSGKQASVSDFFEPVENALKAVEPWARGISTAILVRRNEVGETLLGYLKSKGISRVVFEGESEVADNPVISAMTDLVQLAEHSTDALAYAHIAHSPIARAAYPGGVPSPAVLSASLLKDFTRMGMVRKFREVREALKGIPGTWNDFTESRFEDFIKCAAEFEEIRDAGTRLSDFVDFVGHKTHRDFAQSGMVRIMSMHQSKGLGFDWVILPFYESEKMTGERHVGPLEHSDPDWVMVNPGTSVDMTDAALAKAERDRQQMQVYNSLCLNYVAMTRAKRALTVILHPENKTAPSSPERFSDLVRLVGLKTSGDPAWYEKTEFKASATLSAERTHFARSRRKKVLKSRPSESFYAGLRGDVLFGDDFGKAARRGQETHERFEKIEWADAVYAEGLSAAFRQAFIKPTDDATVWREKPYELFIDGRWESGQFDRVVFTGEGEGRRAVIYDFKTNSIHSGESTAAFEKRIGEMYSRQMQSYRDALAVLTGIAKENIKTVLLLDSTKTSLTL